MIIAGTHVAYCCMMMFLTVTHLQVRANARSVIARFAYAHNLAITI